MNKAAEILVVSLITMAVVAIGAAAMIGPQVLFSIPAAIVAGVVLALRRSPMALICLGFSLLFGLYSALIGIAETDVYGMTAPFAVSVAIGIVGLVLVAVGVQKVLFKARLAFAGKEMRK